MSFDGINATFEGVGSIVLWMNVRQLYKDRVLKGVHIGPIALWFVWGLWNLIYYPSIHQWYSFFAGVNVAAANGVWLYLLIKYEAYKNLWPWATKPLDSNNAIQ
jgi:hypothetical protein